MRKPVSFSMEACPILSATHSVAHTEAEQSVLEIGVYGEALCHGTALGTHALA